jgi:predicted transcriptional regulator
MHASRKHQINLIIGAMLLLSSAFVVPISASSGSRDFSRSIFISIGDQSRVPTSFSGTPQTGAVIVDPNLSPPPSIDIQPPPGSSPSQLVSVLLQGLPPSTLSIANRPVPEGDTPPGAVSAQFVSSTISSSPSILQALGLGWLLGSSSEKSMTFTARAIPEGGVESAAGGESGSTEYYVQIGGSGEAGGPNTIGAMPMPTSGQVTFITTSNAYYVSPTSQSYSTLSASSITSAIPGLWLDSSKRRSRSQIYVEILELMKRGPMTPFEIAFYARLNHKRTKEYSEFLRRSGYLEAVQEDGRLTYVLTKNGMTFLEKMKVLFENNQTATNEYAKFDYSRR